MLSSINLSLEEQLSRETAIIMVDSPLRENFYGNLKACDYIKFDSVKKESTMPVSVT